MHFISIPSVRKCSHCDSPYINVGVCIVHYSLCGDEVRILLNEVGYLIETSLILFLHLQKIKDS